MKNCLYIALATTLLSGCAAASWSGPRPIRLGTAPGMKVFVLATAHSFHLKRRIGKTNDKINHFSQMSSEREKSVSVIFAGNKE